VVRPIGKVIAIVLTYNRKELVAGCLRGCLDQTDPPDQIFLLDNGSTDGTREFLRERRILDDPRIAYLSLRKNVGPAAGFDLLTRLAYEAGCDWMWVMDDDTIPSRNALEELKRAFIENFTSPEQVGFLTSSIISRDGQPNNVPDIDLRADPGRCATWGDLLRSGMVKVRWSTLLSALIPRSTLTRVGSLSPQFYFSGEDIDFALRVTEILPAYVVGKSVVTHLRQLTGVFSILREPDPERIRMYYYFYRNNVYIRHRYYSDFRMLLYVAKGAWEIIQALLRQKQYRLLRASVIARGILRGLVFRPKYRSLSPTFTADERKRYFGPAGEIGRGEQPLIAVPQNTKPI
jgi:GT2 family glycosyltransferase